MFKVLFIVVGTILWVSGALAVSVDSLEGIAQTKRVTKILAGIKSSNSFGRFSKFDALKSRSEVFLGFKTAKGWGASSEIAYSLNNRQTTLPSDNTLPIYGAFSMNRTGIQDPSLDLLHPLYDNGNVKISGMFKESFPASPNSLTSHTWVQGYGKFQDCCRLDLA